MRNSLDNVLRDIFLHPSKDSFHWYSGSSFWKHRPDGSLWLFARGNLVASATWAPVSRKHGSNSWCRWRHQEDRRRLRDSERGAGPPTRHSGPPLRNVLHSSTKAHCDVSRSLFLLLFLSFSPFWRLISEQMNGYPNARIISDHAIIGLSMRPDGGRSTVLFSAGKSGWPGWWPSARYVSTSTSTSRNVGYDVRGLAKG